MVWRSSNPVSQAVNVLWPFVPIAIALRYAVDAPLWIFAMSYLAIIPTANMLSFCGQQFAHKLPRLAGVLLEVAIGSAVEIILFLVLLLQHDLKRTENDDINVPEVRQFLSLLHERCSDRSR